MCTLVAETGGTGEVFGTKQENSGSQQTSHGRGRPRLVQARGSMKVGEKAHQEVARRNEVDTFGLGASGLDREETRAIIGASRKRRRPCLISTVCARALDVLFIDYGARAARKEMPAHRGGCLL